MSFAFLSSIDLCSPLLIWRIHTLSCCWHSRRFCRAGRRTFLLCSRDAFALRQSHDGSTHLPSCLACHNSSWLSSLSPSCITLFPNRATTSASRIGVTTLTVFGRLELEAGAGVVWEKNTVTWLVAGGWNWSCVREKYCRAGGLETSRTRWLWMLIYASYLLVLAKKK